MQIRQTISYSVKKDNKNNEVTGISKSYIYSPKVKAAPCLEVKWHEDIYRERKAV